MGVKASVHAWVWSQQLKRCRVVVRSRKVQLFLIF